ncbi:hypothetical protein ABN067_05140 [Providencia rettgeri]
MTNMSHVDSMTVIGTRLPVEDNTALYFGDGYYEGYNSCLESYRHDVSPEWYHALNDFMDYMSYCEYMATPIDIESLLDKNGKVDLSSKENIETKKEIIKEHIEKQKLFLEKVEGFNEWKFLNNPEKYPFVQEIMISGRLISKEYKTSAELDSFLIGYNENTYLDSLNDNYKYGDGDEEILDNSARESITSVKYLHSRLINAIDVNTENLNKLNFTQSSIFAIPSPNVPTLPHGVGSNSQVTQTADSSIAKGIEKALGNIRDGLAETFDCSFGMSCSNDLDKAAKNPNVGKELTAEEKEALGISSGSSASGTPNGFEPDDVEYRNHQKQNESKFKNFTEEELISSANKPINKQGLSAVARAWDKHVARPDGVFEPLNGNPAQKNAAAENFIREIFKDPKVVRNDLGGGAFEYRLPSGKGVRYNADGSFNTVLDPKKAIK